MKGHRSRARPRAGVRVSSCNPKGSEPHVRAALCVVLQSHRPAKSPRPNAACRHDPILDPWRVYLVSRYSRGRRFSNALARHDGPRLLRSAGGVQPYHVVASHSDVPSAQPTSDRHAWRAPMRSYCMRMQGEWQRSPLNAGLEDCRNSGTPVSGHDLGTVLDRIVDVIVPTVRQATWSAHVEGQDQP